MMKKTKRMLSFLTCLLFCFCFMCTNFVAPVNAEDPSGSYLIPDEIIVYAEKYPDVSNKLFSDNIVAYGLELESIELICNGLEKNPDGKTYSETTDVYLLLKLANASDMHYALSILEQHPEVMIAEQNFVAQLEEDTSGYDPLATEQWYLDKIGVYEGWHDDTFIGSSEITVAVLDTGIVVHDDLQDNVDYEHAYNAYPFPQSWEDQHGHGTKVAGIIGADFDGQGINGVCKNINILPIKITYGSEGSVSWNTILTGITYAIEHGADVINLSATMNFWSDSIINIIRDFDGVFVTAAGNSRMLMREDLGQQCKINDLSNWIVVGASDQNDAKTQASNYDPLYVDLFAPGIDIYTTTNDGGYDIDSGTSFSAPQVSAACAIIMASAPHLTPAQVKDLVLSTVDVVPALEDYCVTSGRLSLANITDALFTVQRPAYSKGDVNGDGYITNDDYVMCKEIVLGLVTPSAQSLYAADVREDGVVNAMDYVMIKRHETKVVYIFPSVDE